MSGQRTGSLKKPRFRFFYIPLALELLLGFIPFLLLGGWYLGRVLSQLTSFESGLNWITMVKFLDLEEDRFEESLRSEGVEILDLASEYGQSVLPSRDLEFSRELFFGLKDPADLRDVDDIRIRFLFRGEKGEILSLNTSTGEILQLEDKGPYYRYAVRAFSVNMGGPDLKRVYYQVEDGSYYASFLPVMTPKPVCYGDVTLSDGSEGTRVVLSGWLSCAVTEANVSVHVSRMSAIGMLGFLLVALLLCAIILWSLRRTGKLTTYMQAIVRGDIDMPEYDESFFIGGGTHEIMELLENFHLMFLSIREYQDSISNIRELYDPLLPSALLALFGRADIRDIVPGDRAEVGGSMLYVRIHSSGEAGEESTEGRNSLIARILKVLSSMNMIVTELDRDYISAFLPDEILQADKADPIRMLDIEGSGADRLQVTGTTGVFAFTVIGIPEHMAIRTERLSPAEAEARKERARMAGQS